MPTIGWTVVLDGDTTRNSPLARSHRQPGMNEIYFGKLPILTTPETMVFPPGRADSIRML